MPLWLHRKPLSRRMRYRSCGARCHDAAVTVLRYSTSYLGVAEVFEDSGIVNVCTVEAK